MKKQFMMLGAAITMVSLLFTSCNSEPKTVKMSELKTLEDSISYGMGLQIGKSYKSDTTIKLNTEILSRAFHEAYTADELSLSDEELQNFFTSLNTSMQSMHQARLAEQAKPEIEKGAKFLAENKTNEGVMETPSGLQYKIVKQGSGKTPTMGNVVSINYKLSLLDGTEIEATTPDHPAEFPINQLIPGMQEAITLMSEGSTYLLWIPSNIGYGNMPSGNIPGGSVLCFEMELLKILQ